MTTEETIKAALADLAAKQQIATIYADEFQRRHDSILLGVKDQLDALAVEMEPKMTMAAFDAQEAERAVKSLVLELGKSVKGDTLHAVYAKGKTTWDGAKLDGMVSLIPQIADARKTGQPSVSIREVK